MRPSSVAAQVRQRAVVHFRANPALVPYYLLLGVWAALGLFTLFAGMLGLLAQGLVFVLLTVASLSVCLVAARRTRETREDALLAICAGAALVVSCPNRAGPHVYFAHHGAVLDAFAREIAAAPDDLWIGVTEGPLEDPAYNVPPGDVGRYRLTLAGVGAVSVGRQGRWVIFLIDGFADNARGVLYVGAGTHPPQVGHDFAFGRVAQLVPLSRPGWYFFTTT